MQALRGVWVNIIDFLDAVQRGEQVPRHQSEKALAAYSRKTQKIYPKRRIKKGSPLEALLAHIF